MRLQLLNLRFKMQQLLKILENIKKYSVALIRWFLSGVTFIRFLPVRHRGIAPMETTRDDLTVQIATFAGSL